MARYIGPKTKIARKFREAIYGPDRSFEKKNYPPGMHGNSRRRGKTSEYGLQLMEKQKAKYTYGILERQFKNIFRKAASKKAGITGEVLLQFIEARLDNTVFRLGIAPSRSAARQLVTHKHILVNNKVVNIPSFQLRPGDIVAVRERSKSLEVIQNSLAGRGNPYSWLEWDSNLMAGKFINYPERPIYPKISKNNSLLSCIRNKDMFLFKLYQHNKAQSWLYYHFNNLIRLS